MELGKYAEAEDALAEANILNNQNPQIWGYLALLCLQSATPRVEEADQSLNQATRLGLGDPTLLERIGASYAALGCYRQAESTLRRATASLDVDTSRKLLGATAGKASPTGASPRVRQAVTNNADMGRGGKKLGGSVVKARAMDPREARLAALKKRGLA